MILFILFMIILLIILCVMLYLRLMEDKRVKIARDEMPGKVSVVVTAKPIMRNHTYFSATQIRLENRTDPIYRVSIYYWGKKVGNFHTCHTISQICHDFSFRFSLKSPQNADIHCPYISWPREPSIDEISKKIAHIFVGFNPFRIEDENGLKHIKFEIIFFQKHRKTLCKELVL